jgi:hypothetical protein
MDVKSYFLNGELEEEVYIEQLVPRAWYYRLDKYLQYEGFRKGSADNNLYIKVTQDGILLIEVYIDDIIFGSIDDMLSQKCEKDMQNEMKFHYLENYRSFWVFRYVKETKEFLFLKLSISDKC